MLDDFLKDDEDTASFLNEIEATEDVFELDRDSAYGFLGMTAGQRIIISLMMFFLVVIAGAFCLLITGSVAF
ncbi:MAG: hypothetical protein DWG76_01935 [Chloroflexi bacterium]|nr:hypothetical protein [Chloroflexota bacterium]MQC26194.1 hypothetical protein [Chloroflexota bacterium]